MFKFFFINFQHLCFGLKAPLLRVQVLISSKQRWTKVYKSISYGQSDGMITDRILAHCELLLAVDIWKYCMWTPRVLKNIFFILFGTYHGVDIQWLNAHRLWLIPQTPCWNIFKACGLRTCNWTNVYSCISIQYNCITFLTNFRQIFA